MTHTACSDHDQSTPAHLTGSPPVLSLLVVAASGSVIDLVAPVLGMNVPGRARLPVGH
jgi:hypothetical protein